MKIDKVLDLTTRGHSGQFRKDGKTPYILHPMKVCDFLYNFGFTRASLFEPLDNSDFNYYAVVLMRDSLEDTDIKDQEILDVSNDYVYRCVDKSNRKTQE